MEKDSARMCRGAQEWYDILHLDILKSFSPVYWDLVEKLVKTSFKAGACFGAEDMKQKLIEYGYDQTTSN